MRSMIIRCRIGSISVFIQPIKRLRIRHLFRESNCRHCAHKPTATIGRINGISSTWTARRANIYTIHCLIMMRTMHRYSVFQLRMALGELCSSKLPMITSRNCILTCSVVLTVHYSVRCVTRSHRCRASNCSAPAVHRSN